MKLAHSFGRFGALFSAIVSVLVALAVAARAQDPAPAPRPSDPPPTPPLAHVARVFTAAGQELTFPALLDALAKVDVVFCGETHLDDVTHRVELELYEGLLSRRPGKVTLSMEMFSTDVQAVLDDYVARRIDEAEFLARSNPWGNYATGYRALVERARRESLPVIGANAPAGVLRKLSMGGAAAFAALSEAERRLLPHEILPNQAAYWVRVAHATRGHVGGAGDADPEKLRWSAQSLWDNTMGWSCAQALARHPGTQVLHVVGGFHTAFGQGTAEQFRLRQPQAKSATVSVRLAGDLASAEADLQGADADYLVFVQPRARGVNEGFHAVTAAREQRYRLHVPRGVSGPKPLLLWLPAEGLRADDGLAFWQSALGDEAVVAVLEPPYPQLDVDLSRGGRWFWADSFEDDTAALARALAQTRAYLERYHTIDPARVVVAGEGEGATAAASAALWGSSVARQVLAFAPRGYRKLGERGLPEDPVAVDRLRVFAPATDRVWWEQELAQHEFRKGNTASEGEADVVQTVRAALGLPALELAGAPQPVLVSGATSARARAWQALRAVGLQRAGRSVQWLDATRPESSANLAPETPALAFPGEWPAAVEERLAAAKVRWLTVADVERAGLPPAPGPFGGTTILVVPARAPAALRDEWRALAKRNPMQRHGRFFRLEVAFADEAPRLGDALAAMVEAKRSNALVVPAVFCAEPSAMLELQRAAAEFAGRVEIAWVPGLGGRIAAADAR